MSKRPPIDLSALTSEQATPMPEAMQRIASEPSRKVAKLVTKSPAPVKVPTENLEALAFKVDPAFRKRFKLAAAESGLKLNALLKEALDAWEEKRKAGK